MYYNISIPENSITLKNQVNLMLHELYQIIQVTFQF